MKSRWILVSLVAVLGLGVYGGNVLATPPSPDLQTTILAKSNFDELFARQRFAGLSDVYVVDNKLPPGATSGWHSHRGPSLILVVGGVVTNYTGDDPTCTGHVYGAGTGFIDPGGGDVHMLKNEGSVQAETIAVQFLPKDATRRIDAARPLSCGGS
jgi:quercetin dioxygenase-like cupin family protein